MNRFPLIRRTRQLNRLVVSAVLTAVGFLTMVVGTRLSILNAPDFFAFELAMAGTLLGLVFGVVYPSWAIRCPNCQCRWVWWAMSRKESGAWLDSLLRMEECPRCGFGTASQERQ